MKKDNLVYISKIFAILIIVSLSLPTLNSQAQDSTPRIPPPRYIEPVPPTREIDGSGITTIIGNPLASSITTRVLDPGDSLIHGLIYYNNYLWASTRTNPGRILRINPSTLEVNARVILPTGLFNAEDIEAANGYIWTITSTDPAYLVQVNPVTMVYTTTALTNGGNDFMAYGESLDYSFGRLWAGGYDRLAEIDISTSPPTFILHDFTALRQYDYVLGVALTNGDGYLWGVYGQWAFTPPYFMGATVVRIDPSNPISGLLNEDLSTVFPDDMVFTNGYLYTSSEEIGFPSYAYRFPNNLAPYTSTLASSTSASYGTFYNQNLPEVFWGAYAESPGIIKQFDLELNQLLSFQLPTNFNEPAEIVFDEDGNMYVSTFQDPAGMLRYTPPDAVTISASRSGADLVLNWNHTDSYVNQYEVWRSSNPYFNPGDAGSVRLANVVPSGGTGTYTDLGVIGNLTNLYYVVRAVNIFGLQSPISNRVGKYDYQLFTTTSLTKNDIALVLNVSGVTDAATLANYCGSYVRRVARYRSDTQSFQTYIVGLPGTNFSLTTGEFVYLYTDTSAPSVVSLVGGVPNAGSVSFGLVSGNPSLKNFVSLPLDQGNLTTAAQVANDIGAGVSRVFRWRGNTQSIQTYIPGLPATDFPLTIGEPFGLQLSTGAPSVWP